MNTVKAVHVNHYGTVLEIDFETGRSPYEVSKEFIGDWVEMVKIQQVGGDMLVMWVAEMGHLQKLPTNALASNFYDRRHPIVGDVIFTQVALVYTNEGPDWKVVELGEGARSFLRRGGLPL